MLFHVLFTLRIFYIYRFTEATTSEITPEMMTTKRLANVLECSLIEHFKIITHPHISQREY
jgi:hypothetical protein